MFGDKKKVQIDASLYEKAAQHAAKLGYATTDEFVAHLIDRELRSNDQQMSKDKMLEKMKGLGYL